MSPDLLLQHVRLADGRRADIAIAGGRIADIRAAGSDTAGAKQVFDGRAYVALPPFVDAHLHLDKTIWGQPWISNGGGPTRHDYIAHESVVLNAHPASVTARANALLDHLLALGTGWLRSHIDITPAFGLRHAEALLSLRAERGLEGSLQLVAFPQAGLLSKLGVLERMRDAMRLGLDVVGGIDPAGFDNDPIGHITALFELAEASGKPIDIHLHDGSDLGAWEIERILDMTAARGLNGRVMISHAYCLGAVPEARAARIAERMARLDVSLMTAAPAWTSAPPVALLLEQGLNICCGSDGIRDLWSPFGTGDMLERAMLLAQRFGWATDAEMLATLACVGANGARALGIADYGIAAGNPAHLLLIMAERAEEIPTLATAERIVIRHGKITHQPEVCHA